MDVVRPQGLEQHSDAELVRLLVAGNSEAMTVIFDRYYRLVMSVALRILHDTSEAEDVTQVVFSDFYRKARLFDETKGNLGTWLLQYAYGRTINHKRWLASRHFYKQATLDEAESHVPFSGRPQVLDLDTREAMKLVEEILPVLNEKQRFVIERVFFEGLKISEVASESGESLGNTHHAYYRGIEKLRRYLSGQETTAIDRALRLKKRIFGRLKKPKSPEGVGGEVESVKARIL
jgi:RNA polymerase sigma-70 factor, ECF subfamily